MSYILATFELYFSYIPVTLTNERMREKVVLTIQDVSFSSSTSLLFDVGFTLSSILGLFDNDIYAKENLFLVFFLRPAKVKTEYIELVVNFYCLLKPAVKVCFRCVHKLVYWQPLNAALFRYFRYLV